jgi:hypothetical protein
MENNVNSSICRIHRHIRAGVYGMSAGVVNAGLGAFLAHGFTLAVFAYAHGIFWHARQPWSEILALRRCAVSWDKPCSIDRQFAGAVLAAFYQDIYETLRHH